MHQGPIALYIHIPFCQTKCNYCNFNTYAGLEALIPRYVTALASEVGAWGGALAHPPVATVFFGGGTPSWLPMEALERVMTAARQAFPIQPGAEITAEANPGDLTDALLHGWRSLGINRISIGVQSFDDGLLRLLTRRHSAEEAVRAYQRARASGFGSVSLDLMYGLPHQPLGLWRRTLERALDLAPPHLSLYALTVEEGTALWGQVRSGEVPSADPDLAADMYLLAEELLAGAGYRHYEISNWALPGHESRHNLFYWRNGPFLGVGPGAHSYMNGQRFWNIKSPNAYIRRVEGAAQGTWTFAAAPVVEDRARPSEAERLSETAILALRLDEGLDTRALAVGFGTAEADRASEALRPCGALGLVTEENGVFRLTSRGRLLSNEVFLRLLPP